MITATQLWRAQRRQTAGNRPRARLGVPRVPAPDTPCIYRSTLSVGRIDCGCSGSQRLYQCTYPDITDAWCTVHAPGKPYAQVQLQQIATPVETTRLPVCALCQDRQPWHWSAGVRLMSRYVVGSGYHRSGWPDAMAAIARYQDPDGILLDDFVEQRFTGEAEPQAYREPWVGVFHYPPDPPEFMPDNQRPVHLLRHPAMRDSLPHLRLAIALSDHLAAWLRPRVPCPVVVIHHPCASPPVYWSPDAWEHARPRRLLMIGTFCRNTRILHQVPQIHGVEKVRIIRRRPRVQQWDREVQRHWAARNGRATYTDVEDRDYVDPQTYDRWLAESVVITELMDASANNGVLDAITRAAPLLVNRHPAAVEYLGPDYPLYYDTPDQVPQLLERAVEAHRYLLRRPRHWLQPREFAAQLIHAIQTHVYGRRAI